MKSKGTAYLLWLFSIFGWLGFHHFYLGKILKGIIWILTGGIFGIGSFIDLFTLGGAVETYNTKVELDTIRRAALANLQVKSKKENFATTNEIITPSITDNQPNISDFPNETSANLQHQSKWETFKSYIPKNRIVKFGLAIIILSIIGHALNYFFEPDYSNPKIVAERFEKDWYNGSYRKCFAHLSQKSQTAYKSLDNYIKIVGKPDSILNLYKIISVSSVEIPVKNYTNFKQFKSTIRYVFKGDTLSSNNHLTTLYNENGKWKIIAVYALTKQASELSDNGEFTKAAELYQSILSINPLSIDTHNSLVWCYLRDDNRPEKWQDSCAFHLNSLLTIDSLDANTYNTLGAYYSEINNKKEAVKSFLYAVKCTNDSSQIANFYSNAAQNSSAYNNSLAIRYLNKSLEYDSNNRFTWQTFGDLLYAQQEYSSAKHRYEKAIELAQKYSSSDNYTLISLYGKYALTCKKLGYKTKAEEYILKCIRVYPDKKHPIFKELNL